MLVDRRRCYGTGSEIVGRNPKQARLFVLMVAPGEAFEGVRQRSTETRVATLEQGICTWPYWERLGTHLWRRPRTTRCRPMDRNRCISDTTTLIQADIGGPWRGCAVLANATESPTGFGHDIGQCEPGSVRIFVTVGGGVYLIVDIVELFFIQWRVRTRAYAECGVLYVVVPIAANVLSASGRFIGPIIRNIRVVSSFRAAIPGFMSRTDAKCLTNAGEPGERGAVRRGRHRTA